MSDFRLHYDQKELWLRIPEGWESCMKIRYLAWCSHFLWTLCGSQPNSFLHNFFLLILALNRHWFSGWVWDWIWGIIWIGGRSGGIISVWDLIWDIISFWDWIWGGIWICEWGWIRDTICGWAWGRDGICDWEWVWIWEWAWIWHWIWEIIWGWLWVWLRDIMLAFSWCNLWFWMSKASKERDSSYPSLLSGDGGQRLWKSSLNLLSCCRKSYSTLTQRVSKKKKAGKREEKRSGYRNESISSYFYFS